jgi:hypothetical protein
MDSLESDEMLLGWLISCANMMDWILKKNLSIFFQSSNDLTAENCFTIQPCWQIVNKNFLLPQTYVKKYIRLIKSDIKKDLIKIAPTG